MAFSAKQLAQLKTNKATGLDNTSAHMLRDSDISRARQVKSHSLQESPWKELLLADRLVKKKNIRNKTRTLKFDLRVLREDSTKYLLITAKLTLSHYFGGQRDWGQGRSCVVEISQFKKTLIFSCFKANLPGFSRPDATLLRFLGPVQTSCFCRAELNCNLVRL